MSCFDFNAEKIVVVDLVGIAHEADEVRVLRRFIADDTVW